MHRYDSHRGIKRLGRGVYRVRAQGTDPRTGRRRSVERTVTCATITEAAKERDRLAAEITEDARERPPRLGDYASSWLLRRVPMLRESTITTYTGNLGHINGALGDYYLDALRPGDVEDWMARSFRAGYSPATINGWLRVLRSVTRDAARDYWIADPCTGVRALREPRTSGPRGRALTPDEFRSLVNTCEMLANGRQLAAAGDSPTRLGVSPDVARMLLTLAWTGVRRGELLALRWDDYADGELHIERAVWRQIVDGTKTGEPRRVAVCEPLAEVLRDQRRWLLEEQHAGLCSGLMFPASARHRRAGTWYHTGSVLTKPLRRVVEAAGLPPISLHSLRRTHEDLMRRAGVPDMVRRAEHGWKTTEAQAIYTTIDAEERAAAASAVVRLVVAEGNAMRDDLLAESEGE